MINRIYRGVTWFNCILKQMIWFGAPKARVCVCVCVDVETICNCYQLAWISSWACLGPSAWSFVYLENKFNFSKMCKNETERSHVMLCKNVLY